MCLKQTLPFIALASVFYGWLTITNAGISCGDKKLPMIVTVCDEMCNCYGVVECREDGEDGMGLVRLA